MKNNKKDISPAIIIMPIIFSSLFYICISLAVFPKIIKDSNIKGEMLKKGDLFAVKNSHLKEYIDILDNLKIEYTLDKSGDITNININR